MAVCSRVRSPDDEHRSFVISRDRLTGDRVDKRQASCGDEAHLAGGLDCLLEPANRSVSGYQHRSANLIGALGGGLLNERRDVAVWWVQPDVARHIQVISPGRFQRVLFGGDELAA